MVHIHTLTAYFLISICLFFTTSATPSSFYVMSGMIFLLSEHFVLLVSNKFQCIWITLAIHNLIFLVLSLDGRQEV